MNRLKLFSIVTAMALTAFALPSAADTPNKHYVMTISVGTPTGSNVNAQTDTPVIVEFFNDNPSGSSAQFGSFQLALDKNMAGIEIIRAEVDPVFGGTIGSPVPSEAAPTTSIAVTGIAPVKAGDTYRLTLHVRGCGDQNNWTAQVWSGSNLNGGTYVDRDAGNHPAAVPCGAIACNESLGGLTVSTLIDTTILDATDGKPRSRRGPYNEDGSCSSAVPYYVTELGDTTDPFFHFRWSADQKGAAFFYILNQARGPDLLFAWKADSTDDVNANPIFVKAQQCDLGINAKFPASYGKLISDSGGSLINVNTTGAVYSAPKPPFRIALGPKPMEYMTVTKIAGQKWTVVRSAGSIVHSPGIDVMSTPVPALQAAACYNSAGDPLASCPYSAGEPARMCYLPLPDTTKTYLFDIGDGYVKGGF